MNRVEFAAVAGFAAVMGCGGGVSEGNATDAGRPETWSEAARDSSTSDARAPEPDAPGARDAGQGSPPPEGECRSGPVRNTLCPATGTCAITLEEEMTCPRAGIMQRVFGVSEKEALVYALVSDQQLKLGGQAFPVGASKSEGSERYSSASAGAEFTRSASGQRSLLDVDPATDALRLHYSSLTDGVRSWFSESVPGSTGMLPVDLAVSPSGTTHLLFQSPNNSLITATRAAGSAWNAASPASSPFLVSPLALDKNGGVHLADRTRSTATDQVITLTSLGPDGTLIGTESATIRAADGSARRRINLSLGTAGLGEEVPIVTLKLSDALHFLFFGRPGTEPSRSVQDHTLADTADLSYADCIDAIQGGGGGSCRESTVSCSEKATGVDPDAHALAVTASGVAWSAFIRTYRDVDYSVKQSRGGPGCQREKSIVADRSYQTLVVTALQPNDVDTRELSVAFTLPSNPAAGPIRNIQMGASGAVLHIVLHATESNVASSEPARYVALDTSKI